MSAVGQEGFFMEKIVYIVHCIDTEGPLYESLTATFERIQDTFGIKLNPSRETLEQLQKKKLDLQGKEDAVARFVEPKRLQYTDTWTRLDELLDTMTSKEFRKKYADSFGNDWIYNWFCLDHVGLTELNPRRRATGYHTVFDHYVDYNRDHGITQDLIQWHFHPIPIVKDMHRSGTGYINTPIFLKILARKIIDRHWFPTAYRPGGHTERADSNWLLEMWIPFDYGNQAMKHGNEDQPDLNKGRFGDWRHAPNYWHPYHPDLYDYQREGSLKRYITRCLNMEARIRELSNDDIRDAFLEAQTYGKSLLSFTNHDEKDMASEVVKVWHMIHNVSKEFKDVKFQFVNAIDGFRKILGLQRIPPPDFQISLRKNRVSSLLKVKAKHDIFGPQPFLAIKLKSQVYYWENFDFQGPNEWSYTFDFHTIDIDAVEKIGIAANNAYGIAEIVVMDANTKYCTRTVMHDTK